MSKFLRTAALVVGGIALAATGIGAGLAAAEGISYASAAGFVAGALGGVSAAALTTTAAGLAVLSQLTAKKPKPIGNPMQWQSDPQAGIPIVIGRAYSAGKIIYRQGWGKDNKWETIHTAYSIGPIQSFDQFYVDGVATSVSGDTTVNIASRGYMFERHQLGAQPEAVALQVGNGGYPPGLDATSKLSGLAASAIQLVYDAKGKTTLTTEPQCGYVLQGVRVYDPRKDSTYPGGAGAQRWNDETTWSYTGKDNPYLAGLAWCIGWRQNGKLVAGVGAPISLILLDQFVEGANVADANGWKLGGILDTTDDKWQRLKDLLLAGGGEPIRLGAQLGCIINTPRVSLASIGVNDVIGDASVQATQAMRDRINAVVPRYMAESSTITSDGNGNLVTTVTWGMAAAGPIVVSDYVTFDGRQRQTQIDFEFVQGPGGGSTAPNQVAQLARYAIENAREFGPITLPLKLRWMGYKPGDVVTCNLPELGLNGQDILLLNRSLDPAKGAVTMTARSETYAKHAFALGQTTTAPATPSVSGPPLIPTPDPADWAITANSYTANGQTLPALVVTGDPDVVADAVIFEYRAYMGTQAADDDWQAAGIVSLHVGVMPIIGLIGGIPYQVSIRYRLGPGAGDRLILGPSIPSLPAGLGGPGAWTILNRTPATVQVVGSTVSKTGGATSWTDASVVSAESAIGGAMAAFVAANQAWYVIGLNGDPGTDDSQTTIDFGWAIHGDGGCDILEGGVSVAGPWTYSAGDVFQVVYNGQTVSYIQNGVVRYSHGVAGALHLWLDSSFNTVGAKVSNLTFAQIGPKGDQGVPGAAGAPGAPGANGQTLYTWVAYADSLDGNLNFTTGTPGGRAYQGIAVNRTTSVESTNPADYQWSQYRGPAAFGLVAAAGVAVGPDYIVKTATDSDWSASAYSSEGWQGGCQLTFTAAQNNAWLVVGINTDPTTDNTQNTIDGGWVLTGGASCEIIESGTVVAGPWSCSVGDVFQIRYDNKTANYYQNGVLRRSNPVPAGLTFYLDSSLSTPGGRASKIAWGAAGASGVDGVSTSASPSSLTVSCYSDGTVKSGEFNKTSQVSVKSGQADVTASATYGITTSGCSATVSSGGLVTFTAISADTGYADVTATLGSYSSTIRIVMSKVRDGVSPAARYPDVATTLGTTTYPTPIALASGQAVHISATVQCSLTGASNSGGASYQLQISPSGAGSWTAIATASGIAFTPTEPLGITVSGTYTNSGGSSAFDVRAVLMLSGVGSPGAVQKSGSYMSVGL